ncbi:hypothetical protein V6N11_055383 [Hibiscus sabdariffa]|uniref:UBN2 domain-containing protein n=1 Tax=Hibiscus sabdariffa TaxID=183260 RepID=A0ABR2PF58_9ROSI
MQTLFKSQDLWELVEEDIVETDDSAKIRENKKNDAKALYLLQQAIHDDIFPTILSASSSREAWLTLQQEYRGDSKAIIVRLQTLMREFETSMMKKDETIQDFLSRVKSIMSQMRNYGEKCSDHIVVTKVLRSLTSRFDHEQKTQSEQMNKCMAEAVEEALVEDEEEEELSEFNATIANGMGMFKQFAGGNKIKQIILKKPNLMKKEKRIARRSWHGLIQKRITNRCGFLTVDVLTT